MLKPREADIPVLFMVLVVLPVIIYIILGKWNDTSKKAAKANILAQLAAEESFREEVMASADILPVVPLWKNDTHVCAKCYAPATSRCSRCKSVGYCSGKCQIVHWRQGHKEECQQWQNGVVNFSAGRGSITDSIHRGSITDVSRDFNGSYTKQHQHSSVHSDEASYWRTDAPTVTHPERNLSDNGLRIRGRPKREMLSDEASIIVGTNNTCADARLVDGSSPDTLLQDALFEVESGPGNFTETNEHQKYDSTGIQNNGSTVRNSASQSQRLKDENKSIPNVAELRKSTGEATSSFKQRYPTGSHENATNGGEAGKNFISYEDRFSSSFVTSGLRPSAEENLVKRNLIYKKPPYILDPDKSVARAPRQCQSQVTNGGIPPSVPTSSPEQCFKGITNGKEMTLKTSRTSSRNPKSRLVGLINGYKRNKLKLLKKSSLICTRLLVMSMQAVCLRDLGGEKKVDPGLQETTLVKCLRCHHESERYENIMDLTLEIYGWVESLEDALTQFTAPEDLDGENMYRCGRCSTYVRARKQLSLHEVPNILTIVLKRFQTGKYGKINKCVTFPDLLDMIPFVTGSADSPPLYILYAVVVHLDTLNTSFSGHYVSYVKDIQGTWFRIDDSEVQVVPLSQVMSEGAYMLFYSRSFPRPPSVCINRALLQAPSLMHNSLKSLKSSRHGQPEETETCPLLSNAEKNSRPEKARSFFSSNEIHTDTVISTDFSDPTSSDWSLFTSSDESSFTTESTRNSFSTVDHEDSGKRAISSSPPSAFRISKEAQETKI
ncbi:Ubiquitin carboxyl-terminal hydrolase 15 [Dendrobium catenatum]|uniref:Ubiquitin carboxyl-terminal hydrolase 15 n=1 Tax=Dendrobium catenatum TaxID=906689 RepID=A0A2I0WAI2_9ASPA|nr:Ubiquitin carboxyl-terminal hydrolase 15 [Dendrobium catenatum]